MVSLGPCCIDGEFPMSVLTYWRERPSVFQSFQPFERAVVSYNSLISTNTYVYSYVYIYIYDTSVYISIHTYVSWSPPGKYLSQSHLLDGQMISSCVQCIVYNIYIHIISHNYIYILYHNPAENATQKKTTTQNRSTLHVSTFWSQTKIRTAF